MIDNEHINKWREYTKQMIKASEEGDFNTMEDLKDLADSEYEAYKNENGYYENNIEESVNFGFANYIIENNLPQLMKNNKDVLKKYIEMVKKDSNLSAQYTLLENLVNCQDIEYPNEYVQEAVDIAKRKINIESINESNKKLYKFIVDNNLAIQNDINDDLYNLFEACDFILTNKKNLKTLNEHIKQTQIITNFIKEKKPLLKENKVLSNVDIDAFNKKYMKLLTVEEQEFVKNIINKDDKDMKKELFESLKEECITDLGTDTEYSSIKEQILNMPFNEASFVDDINKLIEINNIIKQ